MPVITILNGHAFGAGIFLAMAFDYRFQNPSRGYFCLPEVDLGLTIPTPIATLIKGKLPSPAVYREAALEGKRFNGPEALKLGLVDGLGGVEEVLKFIEEKKLVEKTQNGAVGGLKEDAYREILLAFDNIEEVEKWRPMIEDKKLEEFRKIAREVAQWEKGPKL
jgi:enoyl-CoA hydratase/carnithine racemase